MPTRITTALIASAVCGVAGGLVVAFGAQAPVGALSALRSSGSVVAERSQVVGGQALTAASSGHPPGAQVEIDLGDVRLGSVAADSSGVATLPFVVPGLASGAYALRSQSAEGSCALELYVLRPTSVAKLAPALAPGIADAGSGWKVEQTVTEGALEPQRQAGAWKLPGEIPLGPAFLSASVLLLAAGSSRSPAVSGVHSRPRGRREPAVRSPGRHQRVPV